MAALATLEMKGFEALDRKLRRLEKRAAKKVLKRGLRSGAKVIQREAKSRAPVLTGATRKSIRVRAMKKQKRGVVGISVRTSKFDNLFTGDQYYAAFVEFGTSRMEAKPFLEPAFEARKHEASETIKREVAAGIAREAKAG